MNPEPRSISRYKNLDPAGIKIHPLKKIIACLAGLLPKSWRFHFFGLPVRGSDLGHVQADEDIHGVPNGIASQFGAHLDRRGAYIPALTSGAGRFIETRFLQKQRCFPRVPKRQGVLLSLACEGHVNYYRWLMETLPRIRFVQERRLAYDWMYVCQEQPFHRESLRLFGCDSARVLPAEDTRFLQAEKLMVPRFVDEAEPWIIPWLREQFLPLAQARESKSLPKRIYITRREATSRRIVNESEVLARLAPLGFASMVMEDLDWLAQVALFHNAECIIGPHGAGLANLVFCSAPVLVIELMAKEYPYTFYPQICHQLHLNHHLLFCTPLDPSQVRASDLEVDVDEIGRLVDQFLVRLGQGPLSS